MQSIFGRFHFREFGIAALPASELHSIKENSGHHMGILRRSVFLQNFINNRNRSIGLQMMLQFALGV